MIKLFCFALVLTTCMSKKHMVTPSQTPSGERQIATVSDTLVPPVFDNENQMVVFALSADAWKQRLSADAYHVLREEGTERAFTGHLYDNHVEGLYICAGCKLPLYGSEAKFDSGTGWPSFTQPIDYKYIKQNVDMSYGMARTEVECARCGGHLGHVFADGPQPTGKRHCINSVSLIFIKKK